MTGGESAVRNRKGKTKFKEASTEPSPVGGRVKDIVNDDEVDVLKKKLIENIEDRRRDSRSGVRKF